MPDGLLKADCPDKFPRPAPTNGTGNSMPSRLILTLGVALDATLLQPTSNAFSNLVAFPPKRL